MQSPAQIVGEVESTSRYSDFYVDSLGLWGQPTSNDPNQQSENLFAGHTGAANFLFMDGHIKAMRPLATLDQTPDGGSNNGNINIWQNDNKPFNTGNADGNGFTVLNNSQNNFWRR